MESIIYLDAKSHISNIVSMSKKSIEKEFPMHWHDFFEMDIILDGTGCQNFNGIEYPLKKGTAYILNPTDFHSLHAYEPLKLFNVMFDERILSDEFTAMLLNQRRNIITQLPGDIFSKAEVTIDMLLEEYNGDLPFRDKYIKNLMESLLFILMREFKPEHTPEMPYDTTIKKSLLYIHMHFRENPSLQTVAEVAGFCPNYFSDIFHRYVGSTYTEYLTKLKLEYAARLLENSSITSTDLCFECGFSSISNFLKVFKSHFGVSPRAYTKKHGKKNCKTL